jgi:hypothetical protein
MQIRCTYCQMMFAVNHEETLAALENMEEENLKFYDAHCPKCRRANRIERLKLEYSYPGWRDEIKKMVKAAAERAQPAALPPVSAALPKVGSITSPKKKHSHKPAGKSTPKAVKIPIKTKPAPAKTGKPATVKPTVKTTKKPASKPAVKSAPKSMKKPAGKPALKTIKKPTGKPIAGTKKK